jgi:hypothetical protein
MSGLTLESLRAISTQANLDFKLRLECFLLVAHIC